MPWRMLRMDEHFELVKANFIRCEECNENFFFDFLRHPRYFVTHFKSCHLKNLLYRFNGYSEEENSRVRFGPRRKKDANSWFGQLKSTEKRMISMQDNKWSEIAEKECWSCRLCNDGKADLTQVFELSELGRGQAFLHLRQVHERAYEEFLRKLPEVQNAALMHVRAGDLLQMGGPHGHHHHHNPLPPHPARSRAALVPPGSRLAAAPLLPLDQGIHTPDEQLHEYPQQQHHQELADISNDHLRGGEPVLPQDSSSLAQRTTLQQRIAEAERSRLRRMKATAEERHVEALRSKKRRENLTPVQRQADYDRRKRKKKRQEESERSRKRREQASEEMRQKEVLRSRERRRNATEDQRRREAMRSKRRRELASDEQKRKERERCRKRYELKKTQRGGGEGDTGAEGRAENHSSCSSHCSGHRSDDGSQSSTSEYRYHDRQYQQEAVGTYQQQLHADIASRPHDNRRPPAASTITSVPLLHINGTGNSHVPMESVIRGIPLPSHPLPPPPAPSDEVRASFSELTGFRGLLSPSPSAAVSFGAAIGGGGSNNGTRHGIHSFAPTQGLAMYPSSYHHRHLPPSQVLRSTVGGSTSKTSTSDTTVPLEGSGNLTYTTPLPPPPLQPASSSSPFSMPQLSAPLHALSQSLQPLTSSSSSTATIRKHAGGTSSSPSPAAPGTTAGSFSSSDRGPSQSGMAAALDMIGSHLQQQQQHRQHASEKRTASSSSPSSGSLAFV
uniref:Uncharacterized protein n=1 Tax=Globisporangium ultimum (strain ATCC 200006 / CBS 805.95 / DAOM BR144) TaxID=431595 RepID=K3WQS1_GLOUD